MPDFFDDEYYETARKALRRVDGMALPNLLAGRVFNLLFRKVFAKELEPRSTDMVEGVRTYMQSILQKLFQTACQEFPAFLNEVETNLVEEFMDFKQEQTVDAVLNVVQAELGWVFTQDPAYTTTIKNVRDMVQRVRLSEAVSRAATPARMWYIPDNATAVGDVPEDFIKKVIVSKKAKDQDIRNLQVEYHRAVTKYACAHKLTASVYRSFDSSKQTSIRVICVRMCRSFGHKSRDVIHVPYVR